MVRDWIKKKKQKHNEKILMKKGFIHCVHCKRMILKTDNYCQYCGKSMETVDKAKKEAI